MVTLSDWEARRRASIAAHIEEDDAETELATAELMAMALPALEPRVESKLPWQYLRVVVNGSHERD